MKLSRQLLFEVVIIIFASAVIGLFVNAARPNGVRVTIHRPKIEYVEDDVLALDLGDVTIGTGSDELGLDQRIHGPVVISTDQLVKLVRENRAVLLDTRLPSEYEQGHIPSAINIPFERLGEFFERVDDLPKEKWLVCYCDGPPCDLGEHLAFELFSLQFPHVAVYTDGSNGWKNQGGEVQK